MNCPRTYKNVCKILCSEQTPQFLVICRMKFNAPSPKGWPSCDSNKCDSKCGMAAVLLLVSSEWPSKGNPQSGATHSGIKHEAIQHATRNIHWHQVIPNTSNHICPPSKPFFEKCDEYLPPNYSSIGNISSYLPATPQQPIHPLSQLVRLISTAMLLQHHHHYYPESSGSTKCHKRLRHPWV